MATPEQFAKNMAERGLKIEINSSKAVQRVSLAIDAQVVVATPVDTGRARSNWRVGIDAAVTDETNRFPMGMRGSSGQAAAAKAINDAKEIILKQKPGQAIFISNNVKYIGDLNRGTSKQAPKLFVQKAIIAGANAIRGVKILDR